MICRKDTGHVWRLRLSASPITFSSSQQAWHPEEPPSGLGDVELAAVGEGSEGDVAKSNDNFRTRLLNNSQKERTTGSHLLQSGSSVVPWAASNAVDQRNVQLRIAGSPQNASEQLSGRSRKWASCPRIFIFTGRLAYEQEPAGPSLWDVWPHERRLASAEEVASLTAEPRGSSPTKRLRCKRVNLVFGRSDQFRTSEAMSSLASKILVARL